MTISPETLRRIRELAMCAHSDLRQGYNKDVPPLLRKIMDLCEVPIKEGDPLDLSGVVVRKKRGRPPKQKGVAK